MSTYNLIQDGESGLSVRTTLNDLLTAANSGFTSVYYQENTDTYPSNGKSGDVLLITDDGTSGGTVTQEWIYNGGDWSAVFTGLTSNDYLPISGGTIEGNLTVTGTTSVSGMTASTLNLTTIGSGTSVTNLGIDVDGNIVSGGTSQPLTFSADSNITQGYAVRLKENGKIVRTDYTENGVINQGLFGTTGGNTSPTQDYSYVDITNQVLTLSFVNNLPTLFVGTVNPTTKEIVFDAGTELSTTTKDPNVSGVIHYDATIGRALVAYKLLGSSNIQLVSIQRSGSVYTKITETSISISTDTPTELKIFSNGVDRFYVSRLNTLGVVNIRPIEVGAGFISAGTVSPNMPTTSQGHDINLGVNSTSVLVVSRSFGTFSMNVLNTTNNTWANGSGNNNIVSIGYPTQPSPNMTLYNDNGTYYFAYIGTVQTGVLKFTLTNGTTPVYGGFLSSLPSELMNGTGNWYFTGLSNAFYSLSNNGTIRVGQVNLGLAFILSNYSSVTTLFQTQATNGFFQDTLSNYYGLGNDSSEDPDLYWNALGVVSYDNSPIIGIAQQSGVAGSIIEVVVENQISTVQSGLTPSFNYYANPDGSLSLNGDTYMGIALSPTELNLMFSNPAGNSIPSLSVIDNTITNPDNITSPGRYIVPASGVTGSFVGEENNYADYDGSTFTFVTPTEGDKVSIATGPNAGNVYNYTGGQWVLSAQVTTLPTSNWVSSASYKQFDLVIYQNFLYQANGNIPANTAFNVGTTGATWKPINNGVVAEYGNATVNAANGAALSTSVPTTLLTFNIPSAGVWELISTITLNSANGASTWAYYDSSGTIVPNTTTTGPFEASGNLIRATTRAVQVTTTGPTTYTVRGLASVSTTFVNNSTNGFSTGVYNKIGGFAPVVGQVSNYRSATLFATLNGSGSLTPVDFTGTLLSVGTIPLTSNGIWTLTAGVTYELFASVTYDAGGTNQFQGGSFSQFVDATTNVPLPNQNGFSTLTPFFTGRGVMINGVGTFEYTPSTNQTIKLRCTFQNNTGTLTAQTNIKQLGTTNTSAFTGVISPSWNISNSYPLGSIVINGDAMYQANSLIPAGTPFVTGLSGATWKPINGGGVIPEYGQQNLTTDFNYASGISGVQTLLTFTLPTAGVWSITYNANPFSNSGNQLDKFSFYLIDSNGNTINNTTQIYQSDTNANDAISITDTLQITTTGPATYRLVTNRIVASSTMTVLAQGTSVAWQKISGFAPVVGQSTSYLTARRTGTAQTGINAGTTLIFNQKDFGEIPYNTSTGIFTLDAGKTYKISSGIQLELGTGYNYINYGLYNNTTSSFVGIYGSTESLNSYSSFGNGNSFSYTFTPSVTTQMSVRVLNVAVNGAIMRADYSWLTVEQLGTTNTSAFTGVISPSWSSGNTYSLGTLVVNESVLYQANGLVPAGTPFITGTSGATWRQIGLLNGEAEYGEATLANDVSLTNANTVYDLITFTLPTAGVWEVDYIGVGYSFNLSNTQIWIADTNNNVVQNSRLLLLQHDFASNALYDSATGVVRITTTGPTSYKLRAVSNISGRMIYSTNNNSFPGTKVSWKKISGFLPATSPGSVPNWTSAGTIQSVGLSGTTTTPTLATGQIKNNVSYKQLGPKTWQVMVTYAQSNTTGANAGSGDYVFTLPNGLQFDTTLPSQMTFTGNVGSGSWVTQQYVLATSQARITNSTGSPGQGGIVPWDATRYRVFIPTPGVSELCVSSGWFPPTNGDIGWMWQFTFQTP